MGGAVMFRKRRAVPPYFRAPVPFNPFTGKYAQFGPDRELFKHGCDFTLSEDITISDETATATFLYQWGPQPQGHVNDSIVVYNMETPVEGEYFFSGEEGDIGRAVWDIDEKWKIVCLGSGLGMKQLCRFTLNAELTTAQSSKAATIQSQYGPGIDHPSTSITVCNCAIGAGGAYIFEGASGAAGLAIWDSDTNWRIIQMECPA
jgi:hypothetical protein